jgi:hypothetical protein
MFMGISCAHTAKHRATFGQRVTRSSKPPIRREEVVSDGNWCQLFAKAATKADIEFVGNVPLSTDCVTCALRKFGALIRKYCGAAQFLGLANLRPLRSQSKGRPTIPWEFQSINVAQVHPAHSPSNRR